MSLASSICTKISLRMVRGRKSGDAGENPHTFDQKKYEAWRTSELTSQIKGFVEPEDVRGLDVLDFGCGHGDLSFLVADWGPRSVTSIDVQDARVETARERAASLDLAVPPQFLVASTTDTIDLDDASVDVILCFDVLEHIMDYEAIIPEWRRILRPGGRVMIWWVPWWNPWGPHIESLVPIPWAHVFFSDRALIETCANVYDHEDFKPRVWDLDDKGEKKPNKWRGMERLPDVNRLTIGRFQRLARRAGLEIEGRDVHGFGSTGIKRASRILTRLPLLGELFTSYVTYRLRRP